MSPHLKAFIAAMIVTIFAMVITRWVIAGTSLAAGFDRRRKYWILATILTFAMPNYWVAMLLLGIMGAYAAYKDKNPVAVFLFLLLAVPPIGREIEKLGPINYVFTMSPMRALSLAIFLPMAIRLAIAPRAKGRTQPAAMRAVDWIVALFSLYVIAVYTPYENITSILRRAAHLVTDFVLPYIVISRWIRDRETVIDCAGTLLTAGLIVGVVAVFEHFKSWLLWDTIPEFWGVPAGPSLFLVRDGNLRAVATAGHQLVLGHFLVVCMGLLGIFRSKLTFRRHLVALVILVLALYSIVSRGPWLGALVALLMAGLFTTNMKRYYGTLLLVGTVAVAGLLVSPLGDKFINMLPIVGTVEQENVSYRKEILDTTLLLVRQRPLFGSVKILDQLEHLRQGQGIIDLVNVYAEFALIYGLIGLGLFVLFLGSGLKAAVSVAWAARKRDRSLFILAGNLGIALLGSMVLLAGLSNYLSVPMIYTALVGLLVATARLHKRSPLPTATYRQAAERALAPQQPPALSS